MTRPLRGSMGVKGRGKARTGNEMERREAQRKRRWEETTEKEGGKRVDKYNER